MSKLNHDLFFRYNSYQNKWKLNKSSIYVYSIQFCLLVWFCIFVVSIIMIRYHYSADVAVAIIVVTLLTTNSRLSQFVVQWLYRPCYSNTNNQWWNIVYINTAIPYNKEQFEYISRIQLLGTC